MLITRKSDYALRVFRALRDGEIHNVRQICDEEDIPKAFAYKIVRELEQNDLLTSERGNQGGYKLNVSLDEVTLYDVMSVTEDDIDITKCMKDECSRNSSDMPCKVHNELYRIQLILHNELSSKTIAEIIK